MDAGFWHGVIGALWLFWLGYWIFNAFRVKKTRWRAPWPVELLHRVPLALAAVLLFAGHGYGFLSGRFLPQTVALGMLGTLIVALGLGFAVWARRHLGANWSAAVTLKEGHTLIRSGPYALVRHPIYSGMLLAVAGTVIAFGEWRDLLAFGLVLFALVVKARVEERGMRATFADYEHYRRETAALIPFVY